MRKGAIVGAMMLGLCQVMAPVPTNACAYAELPTPPAVQAEAHRRDIEELRSAEMVHGILVIAGRNPTAWIIPEGKWDSGWAKNLPPNEYHVGWVTDHGHGYVRGGGMCGGLYWRPNPFDFHRLRRGKPQPNATFMAEIWGYFVRDPDRNGRPAISRFVVLTARRCDQGPNPDARCVEGEPVMPGKR